MNLLVKHSEFVADPVSNGGNSQRSQGVNVACRKAPQAAVSQPGLAFLRDDTVQIEAELSGGLPQGLFHLEVEQVIGQVWPHQKFSGQITNDAYVMFRIAFPGREPAGEDAVAHRVCDRHEIVHLGGGVSVLAHYVLQVLQDGLLQHFDRDGGTVVIGCRQVTTQGLFLNGRAHCFQLSAGRAFETNARSCPT